MTNLNFFQMTLKNKGRLFTRKGNPNSIRKGTESQRKECFIRSGNRKLRKSVKAKVVANHSKPGSTIEKVAKADFDENSDRSETNSKSSPKVRTETHDVRVSDISLLVYETIII